MPGVVVVVDEHRLARDALEHADVLVGERRALSGDGVFEAVRVEPDAVDLPFAHYHLAVRVLSDRARGAVESKEDVRLPEDRRLGGVHVLPRPLVLDELAPGKADDAPLPVADREHEPSAEPVVACVARAFRSPDDARGLGLGHRVPVLLGPFRDGRGALRRVADEPRLGEVPVERAAAQVLARDLRLLQPEEAAAVELRKFRHQRVQPLPEARLGVLALLDLDAALRGELPHGLDEGEPLLPLDKLYGIARLAAPEAVVESP